jgi:hypothetical protein
MATTPEGITVIPTDHHEVVALLASETLAAVERAIATAVGVNVVYNEPDCVTTTYTRAEISVSGLTVAQIADYLRVNGNQVIAFGIAFLQAKGPPAPPAGGVVLGLGNGFGITYAIRHHFLAQRTKKEFHAFLKNRRIKGHTKFAKELLAIYQDILKNIAPRLSQ